MLQRAVALFNEQGYDATSMSDLARELGLTKSAIYHHVPSKSHLLAQALDEALDHLEAVIEQAGDISSGSAYERLRTAVRQSVDVLVAHQPAVTLLLRVRGNSDLELDALRRRRRIDAGLAELVGQAQQEGSIRDDLTPELISRLLFGMVNSLIEWYRADGSVEGETLARSVATVAFDGLASRASR